MPQEDSKRGAHFAKVSGPQASSLESASVEDEIRSAWSAAADPGETAVYLRAAGAGTVLSRTVLSSARPDETAVFPPPHARRSWASLSFRPIQISAR